MLEISKRLLAQNKDAYEVIVAWDMKLCLSGYWNIKSNYFIMRTFSLCTESECTLLFEFSLEVF